MGTISEQAGLQGEGSKNSQREALEESEKQASEQQPENFKEQATAEKKVEIGPDVTDAPIKGIDPAG